MISKFKEFKHLKEGYNICENQCKLFEKDATDLRQNNPDVNIQSFEFVKQSKEINDEHRSFVVEFSNEFIKQIQKLIDLELLTVDNYNKEITKSEQHAVQDKLRTKRLSDRYREVLKHINNLNQFDDIGNFPTELKYLDLKNELSVTGKGFFIKIMRFHMIQQVLNKKIHVFQEVYLKNISKEGANLYTKPEEYPLVTCGAINLISQGITTNQPTESERYFTVKDNKLVLNTDVIKGFFEHESFQPNNTIKIANQFYFLNDEMLDQAKECSKQFQIRIDKEIEKTKETPKSGFFNKIKKIVGLKENNENSVD